MIIKTRNVKYVTILLFVLEEECKGLTFRKLILFLDSFFLLMISTNVNESKVHANIQMSEG
jgi:hypothetical protein